MAKDPAFLFYSSDFLMGTALMTLEERGQYITVLCLLHQHGGCLTKEKLERAVGVLSEGVVEKLTLTKHGYHQKRLTEETIKRNNFIQSRVDNGLKGGRPPKPSAKANGKAKNNLGVNVNRDVNRDKYIDEFTLLWTKYPRKIGKDGALSHFKATVKNDTDLKNINKALDNYIISTSDTDTKYIKHGSSWFNNWKDWVEYSEPKQPKKGSWGI